MDSIITYMKNGMWKDDLKFERKMYLRQLAKKSSKRTNIASKIGGMLIYNQLIEECLKDLVEYSAYYIKATMWPTQIDLSFDFSKSTFGGIIQSFQRYVLIEYNRDIIIDELKNYGKKRNEVVHHLFDIHDLSVLGAELDEYALRADEILSLLFEYDNAICEEFCELCENVDFSVQAE